MTRPGLLFVASLVLLISSANAQLRLGPERSLSSSQIARAWSIETQPEIATDGHDFLAVWVDSRSGEGREIYASRLNTAGEPLDPLGIRVTEIGSDRFAFDVAFGASTYFILDNTLAITEVDRAGSIVARRSTGLTVNAPGTIKLRRTGAGFIALWGYGAVYSAALNLSGVAISEPVLIGGTAVQDLALNQSSAIALVNAPSGLQAIALDASGHPVAEPMTLTEQNSVSRGYSSPLPRNDASIATDGRDFLAVWHNMLAKTIEAQAIAPGGTKLGEPITLIKGGNDLAPLTPKVTWTGAAYVVTYYAAPFVTRLGRLESVRVDLQRKAISPPVVQYSHTDIAIREFSVPAASASPVVLAAFGHPNAGEVEADLFSKKIDSAGDWKLVTMGWPSQVAAAVSFNAGKTGLTWLEFHGSTTARRDPVIMAHTDRETIDITPETFFARTPSLTAGKNTFLTVWSDSKQTYVQAVGFPARTLPPPPGFAIPAQIAVAATASDFAILRVAESLDLMMVDETGNLLSTSAPLTTFNPFGPPKAALTCNSTICVAAFTEVVDAALCPRNFCAKRELRVARFSRSGALLDGEGIAITRNVSSQAKLEIATIGEDFMLAFSDGRDLRVAHLDATGAIVSGETESIVAKGPPFRELLEFAIAAVGNTAVVAWSDAGGLFAVTVRGSQVSDAMLIVRGFAHRPSLAAAGDRLLLAYDTVDPERGTPAVFLRELFIAAGRERAISH